jgi:hypothetical protein
MNQPPVQYESNSLVITIQTSSPAVTHHLLMRGINEAVQYFINHPEKRKAMDGLIALLELQKTMLPREEELEKAYD